VLWKVVEGIISIQVAESSRKNVFGLWEVAEDKIGTKVVEIAEKKVLGCEN
jgi:hypothetical protein